ncbi:MAG: hypothetical protein GY828_06375 [Candidatus Gracilibacteria bacterium]|nr:hypothetical protein [Candidatus Gracilibacteria bacterium]
MEKGILASAVLTGALAVSPVNAETAQSPVECLAEGFSQQTKEILCETVSASTKFKTEIDFGNINLEEFVANHKENQIKEQYEDFFAYVKNPDNVISKSEPTKRQTYENLSEESQKNLLEFFSEISKIYNEEHFTTIASEKYAHRSESFQKGRMLSGKNKLAMKMITLFQNIDAGEGNAGVNLSAFMEKYPEVNNVVGKENIEMLVQVSDQPMLDRLILAENKVREISRKNKELEIQISKAVEEGQKEIIKITNNFKKLDKVGEELAHTLNNYEQFGGIASTMKSIKNDSDKEKKLLNESYSYNK